jgi:hypothetical protein
MTHAPEPPKLALNQQDAAEALGVSPDFFQQHLCHEIRCVRRGRRRLYPISELQRWLDESASRAGQYHHHSPRFLRENTIETRLRGIFRKLEIRPLSQLARAV